MLKKVGMGTAGKIQLRKYSKGMLQRVGLAKAILHDPKLVILDEPMSGLDPVGRREVRDIILELKNVGKTILFSTHILSDAEMLCDRVGVIAGGKLRGVGAPGTDRKSTRLNSSHGYISYAVFCLKKKKTKNKKEVTNKRGIWSNLLD